MYRQKCQDTNIFGFFFLFFFLKKVEVADILSSILKLEILYWNYNFTENSVKWQLQNETVIFFKNVWFSNSMKERITFFFFELLCWNYNFTENSVKLQRQHKIRYFFKNVWFSNSTIIILLEKKKNGLYASVAIS